MKFCVAQTRPFKGDINKNIISHLSLIDLAVKSKVDAIFFPELSITGYEPKLAQDLATNQNDKRLDVFQKISDAKNITIGIGLPTRIVSKIFISMVIFQPNKSRLIYSKQYLHVGEEQFFTKGIGQTFLNIKGKKIAPAICYEASVAEHNKFAIENGANIYVASVLNSVEGINKELEYLSKVAKKQQIIVCMSNYVGESGGYKSAGKSSIWNKNGILVGQLDTKKVGILIFDTNTEKILVKYEDTLVFI